MTDLDGLLAYFSIGAQGAGALGGAVGSYFGATAQRDSLNAAAGIDDINAATSERTAQAALAAGQHQEQQIRLNTANLKSKQVSRLAANGVDVGSAGSAALLTTTDVLGDIDANTANANAVRAAWGYRTQASNYASDAVNKRAGADATNPSLSAATSLIGGAGQVASSWYRMNKSGAFAGGVGGTASSNADWAPGD